jgi:hypothetical protein
LSRLDAIKIKVEAKRRGEPMEETNTNTNNKRKADQMSPSDPEDKEANQVTKKLKLDHNNTTTDNVNTLVLLSSPTPN